ncbi:MAG: chorismate mutase [Leptospirales bacterium]|nr:chorismate mutase [Leptospirales bacterium]
MKSNEMDELRSQIDQIDQQIVELIRKRTRLTEEIGSRKKKDGLPIYRSDRHTAVYHKVARGIDQPLLRRAIQSIYREIMSLGMAAEGELSVFCTEHTPGQRDAYHAARLAFGTSVRIEPCDLQRTLEQVIVDVNAFGFLPATGEAFSHLLDLWIGTSVHPGFEKISIYAEAFSDRANEGNRYFVLSRSTVEPTGDDCTCIAFIPEKTETIESLAQCILQAGARVFETRTVETGTGTASRAQYSILDFSGHRDEAGTAMILETIKSRSRYFKILGSFPRAVVA